MKKFFTAILFAMILVPFTSVSIIAGELTIDKDKEVTVDEVVKALKPEPKPDIKLRGINYKPEPPEPKIVSVVLEFEKDSYKLTKDTKHNLDIIGMALNSGELQNYSFTLEGHADASGSAAYNLELSRKRAEAVKKYLVEVHKVDPSKLRIVGKGEADLLDPANPYSGKNRRVRIITNQ